LSSRNTRIRWIFIRDSLVDLLGSTIGTYSGRGGELYDTESKSWKRVGKERVKREFSRDDGQVDVLVCTDSASEGLNLQECGALINYDLPWNPMRVEQRIGRIDRIGQRFDEVRILNYSYKDTVETDIYDRLDDRIGLFENVVGEMQPILSGVSGQIRDATLNTDRTEREQLVEEADSELSEEIDQRKQRGRVGVGESLDSVDTLVEQDVVNEAKLGAWQSYEHPDIAEVGENDYAFAVPYRVQSIEAVLRDSTGTRRLRCRPRLCLCSGNRSFRGIRGVQIWGTDVPALGSWYGHRCSGTSAGTDAGTQYRPRRE